MVRRFTIDNFVYGEESLEASDGDEGNGGRSDEIASSLGSASLTINRSPLANSASRKDDIILPILRMVVHQNPAGSGSRAVVHSGGMPRLRAESTTIPPTIAQVVSMSPRPSAVSQRAVV